MSRRQRDNHKRYRQRRTIQRLFPPSWDLSAPQSADAMSDYESHFAQNVYSHAVLHLHAWQAGPIYWYRAFGDDERFSSWDLAFSFPITVIHTPKETP